MYMYSVHIHIIYECGIEKSLLKCQKLAEDIYNKNPESQDKSYIIGSLTVQNYLLCNHELHWTIL